MRIAEAARVCGLSAHTIRYYEKSGMLPQIDRGGDGHRRFTQSNIEWMTLLFWLRETGMSMKQMHRFAQLAKSCDSAIDERREILSDHAQTLKEKRVVLEKCESVLAIKIASYGVNAGERN